MEHDVIIIDHTLRDGEQQPFVNFSQRQKIAIAKQLEQLGVDYIDLMPISSSVEHDTALRLSQYTLLLSTPLNKDSVAISLALGKDIVLFQAVSDVLMQIRYKTSVKKARDENIRRFVSFIQKIRKSSSHSKKIFVAGEDCGRSHLSYLVNFVQRIQKYVDGFIVADSIGCMLPDKIREMFALLKAKTNLPLGIHAHNDLGFADENTITAVQAGATIITGTLTGIGERAGNANIGNVLRLLRDSHNITFPRIDYSVITKAERLVFRYAKRGPMRPFSKDVFFVESGIHVDALIHSPTAYSLVDPTKLGYNYRVVFGKKSGKSNFRYYFKDRFSDDQLQQLVVKVKEFSIRHNKTYSLKQIRRVLHI